MKHRQLILHGEHLLMSSRVVNKNQASACILFWAGLAWILVAQFWQYFLITMVGCNCYFAWTSINQKAVQSDFFPNTYFTKRPTIILGTFQIQTSSKLLCKEESIFNNGTLLRELGKYHSPHLSDGKQEIHREAGLIFLTYTDSFTIRLGSWKNSERTLSLCSHFLIHGTKKNGKFSPYLKITGSGL